MKKNNTFFIFGGVCIMAALLVFTACNDPMNTKGGAPGGKGTGTVHLSIGDAYTVLAAQSRTIFPDLIDDFSYELVFTKGDVIVNKTIDTAFAQIPLAVGTWDLAITAKHLEKNVGTAHVSGVVVTAGETTEVVAQIVPLTGVANGTLAWSLDFAETFAGTATLTVGKMGETPVHTINVLDTAITVTGTVRSGTLSLAPGSWFVRVVFAETTGSKAGYSDIVHVYTGLTSSVGWEYNSSVPPLCPDCGENPCVCTVAGEISPLAGQLLIFQVGAATDGAITCSFVELYNTTNSSINLSAYSLQYAGTIGIDWTVIKLTGTIPAKGSYLVRGPLGTITADSRLYIETADQTINDFSLSNRNFKVALMANQKKLTVINPFAMTGGKAAGYVDLVGARNAAADNIDAFEAALAQVISKQAAARRSSLNDTDNNSADFERIDYRTCDLAQYRPRYSGNGSWTPFPEPGEVCPDCGNYPCTCVLIVAGAPDSLAGKLLILQAFGSGASGANGVSSSFVELYNTTNTSIPLTGITLYYADGTRSTIVTEDEAWKTITLTGTIPAKTSYLILGPNTSSSARYQVPANSGDINKSDFIVSNRAFKVALIRSTGKLTAQNPFNMNGNGATAAGYIDMVGAANAYQTEDLIFGFETYPARNSGSAAVRRSSLVDNNNNSTDFASTDYRVWSASNPDRMTEEQLLIKKPKNLAFSAWNPFPGIIPTPATLDVALNKTAGAKSSRQTQYNPNATPAQAFAGPLYPASGFTFWQTQPVPAGENHWVGTDLEEVYRIQFVRLTWSRGDNGEFDCMTEFVIQVATEDPGTFLGQYDTGGPSFSDAGWTTVYTYAYPKGMTHEDVVAEYGYTHVAKFAAVTDARYIRVKMLNVPADQGNSDWYTLWSRVSGFEVFYELPLGPSGNVNITFNPEVEFNGVQAQYTVTGSQNVSITLTNYAQYSAVYYILNGGTAVPVSNGAFTIANAALKNRNDLLIVVSLNGLEYSKPIVVNKR